MIPMQERTRCAIGETPDLEPLYRFDSFPVFMGCTDEDPETDLHAPMDWWISKKSGLIQLKRLVPLDVLYAHSHGSGCIGGLWESHHNAFADFIRQFQPKAIIEIGGGHGLLSKAYHTHSQIPWTIVEPNPSPAQGVKATYIKDFFDERFLFQGQYDAVVHSHVFEHIYDPHTFMKHLSEFTQQGKMHLFSVPNIQRMLERHYTNGINFEHTLCLTEPYIEHLLAQHGFRICNKHYFMEDHSIFYATTRDISVAPTVLSQELYTKNKHLYTEYVEYHLKLVSELNKKIKTSEGPVYLFGAHVFAQYVIAFGLETSRLVGVLDNDPNKQGKRLYGTRLSVFSPHVLREQSEPRVILKAGVYNDEIKTDILGKINPLTHFWE